MLQATFCAANSAGHFQCPLVSKTVAEAASARSQPALIQDLKEISSPWNLVSSFQGRRFAASQQCRPSQSLKSLEVKCTAVDTENQNGPARPGPPPKDEVPLGEFGERVVLGEFDDEDEDMSIKLECDESGCVLVVGKKLKSLQEEKAQGFLHCDLNGCYYDVDPPQNDFKVVEGAGWRLGYETAPASEESFCAMLGAGGWSIALTASEFNDFTKLIQMLRKGIVTMDQDGIIGRDDVVMQVERGTVWMECVLPKKRLLSLQKFWKFGGRDETSAFELRFVLGGTDQKRQAEGYWPAEAVMDMLRKVDELVNSSAIPALPEEPAVVTVVEPTPAAA